MSDKAQIDGLGFDKLVFEHLEKESQRDGRERSCLRLKDAEDEIGLKSDQILRAINLIRQKGYPVVATLTRRTKEDGFKIPQTEREYMEWRNLMVDDMKSLQETLKICDAGAKAKFGVDMPVQELMF